MASLEDLSQTIGQVREKYSTQVSRDIAHLDKLIGDLEAKQSQPGWQLMQVSVAGFPLPSVPSRMTWAPSTAISSAQVSTRQRSCDQTPLMTSQEPRVAPAFKGIPWHLPEEKSRVWAQFCCKPHQAATSGDET